MAGTLQVLWGQADGTFKKAAELTGTDGKALVIPGKGEQEIIESICTRAWAVDWDYDGDLDLVVGNFAGKFYLFTGEGGGKFGPRAEPIRAGGEPLKLAGKHSAHGDPFVIDWDGDGDMDILSGTAAGGVQWAENTAGPKKLPALKPFKTLIAPPEDDSGEARPEKVTAAAGSTRIWVADVNDDRKLDILVGDSINLISPADGLSEAEFTKRYAEWKDAFAAASAELAGVTDEEKRGPLYEKMNKLYEQRSTFMHEDRTGFVWLYLQK